MIFLRSFHIDIILVMCGDVKFCNDLLNSLYKYPDKAALQFPLNPELSSPLLVLGLRSCLRRLWFSLGHFWLIAWWFIDKNIWALKYKMGQT